MNLKILTETDNFSDFSLKSSLSHFLRMLFYTELIYFAIRNWTFDSFIYFSMFILLLQSDLRAITHLQKVLDSNENLVVDTKESDFQVYTEHNLKVKNLITSLGVIVIVFLLKISIIIAGFMYDDFFGSPGSFWIVMFRDFHINIQESDYFTFGTIFWDVSAELCLFFSGILIVMTESTEISFKKHNMTMLRFWYNQSTMTTMKALIYMIYFALPVVSFSIFGLIPLAGLCLHVFIQFSFPRISVLKLTKFQLASCWIALYTYIFMMLQIVTWSGLEMHIGNYLFILSKLDNNNKAIECTMVVLIICQIIFLHVSLECYILDQGLHARLEKIERPKNIEIDFGCLQGTMFEQEFCRNFDAILDIENSTMLDHQNEINYPFIKELNAIDVLAYEKKCLKAYEASKPGFCKKLGKSCKRLFSRIAFWARKTTIAIAIKLEYFFIKDLYLLIIQNILASVYVI